MCWTDQILYLGNWYGARGVQEPCGHSVVQGSHRCTRARLQIRGRLFGWLPSRYEWRGGKAFCAKREKVTHRVCGLCPACHEAKGVRLGETQSHNNKNNNNNNHNTHSYWSAKNALDLQEKDRVRADRDAQARSRQKLRQADKMQRARGSAGISGRCDRSFEDIRAQAVRRAAIQRGGEIHLPPIPAPPIAHVSRSAPERHSAPVPPPRAPGRAPVSRRPVPLPQPPRSRSDGADLRSFDASLIPSPLSIGKKRAGSSSTRRDGPVRPADTRAEANSTHLVTIGDLEDYINCELAGRVGAYGVVRPSQRQSTLEAGRPGASEHPSVARGGRS